MHWHQGGFLGIRAPDLSALGLSFFSPLRGLFALSPFLAVAVPGLKDVKAKDRAQFAALVVLLGTHTYFTSSFAYDSWGWTVGPRHLTGLLPFLMLPVAAFFERTRASGHVAPGVVAGLATVSVAATGVVGFVNYVPDTVSSSLWGLALPLLGDGFWPVSWLAALVPNPASGAVLVALLIAATAWVAMRFKRQGAVLFVFVGAAVLHLAVLRVLPCVVCEGGGAASRCTGLWACVTRAADEPDRGATKFLESVWVAPNGKALDFRAR